MLNNRRSRHSCSTWTARCSIPSSPPSGSGITGQNVIPLTQHEIETQHGALASYEGVTVVVNAEGLGLVQN